MKHTLALLTMVSLVLSQDQRKITVTGIGRAVAAANVAVFSFDVTNRDSKPSSAVADNQTNVREFMDLLKRVNVESKNITVSTFAVEPVNGLSNGDSKIEYVATSTFTVSFTNIGKIGDQLDKIFASKLVTKSAGPKWMFSGPESLYTRAYADGLADCDAKASAMAKIIGKKIGRFVGVSALPAAAQEEIPLYEGDVNYFVMAAATKLPVLIPQRLVFRANVTATFELTD